MQGHFLGVPRLIIRRDFLAHRNEVHLAGGFHVVTHELVALGGLRRVVEGHTGRNHVDERKATVRQAPLIKGTNCALSPEKLRAT